MRRINVLIKSAEQSIASVETPELKKAQIEAAKELAPKVLSGIWLELGLLALNILEATIKMK
jgi:hypothetical protein